MNIGDAIKCRDAEDMVETMYKLMEDGIYTDFLFEKDGEKGLWLEVVAMKGYKLPTDRQLNIYEALGLLILLIGVLVVIGGNI